MPRRRDILYQSIILPVLVNRLHHLDFVHGKVAAPILYALLVEGEVSRDTHFLVAAIDGEVFQGLKGPLALVLVRLDLHRVFATLRLLIGGRVIDERREASNLHLLAECLA